MKIKEFTFLIILLFGNLSFSYGQSIPKMRNEDKIRIKEAITISQKFGDKIWNGINNVPFVVLLVTDSVEFLVNHPYPSEDFKLSEEDKLLNTKIFYRERTIILCNTSSNYFIIFQNRYIYIRDWFSSCFINNFSGNNPVFLIVLSDSN